MHKHLYTAFWRPDILAEFAAKNAPAVTICDLTVACDMVTCDTRDLTCPACQATFLNALPTGDGTKLTYAEYLSRPEAAPILSLKDKARIAGAGEVAAGWSTDPTKLQPVPWPTPAPEAEPPGSPVWDGWGSGWQTK